MLYIPVVVILGTIFMLGAFIGASIGFNRTATEFTSAEPNRQDCGQYCENLTFAEDVLCRQLEINKRLQSNFDYALVVAAGAALVASAASAAAAVAAATPPLGWLLLPALQWIAAAAVIIATAALGTVAALGADLAQARAREKSLRNSAMFWSEKLRKECGAEALQRCRESIPPCA
jgi:hypothetical protein